jgi:hypothetical protein
LGTEGVEAGTVEASVVASLVELVAVAAGVLGTVVWSAGKTSSWVMLGNSEV